MSLVEIAAQSAAGVRWHVYLAPIRNPQFGENPKAVLRWHVRPYLASTSGKNRVHVDTARQFRSLPAALIHARNECRRFYRRTTR